MINQYLLNEEKLTLKSDLAGEFPLYIYQSDNKQTLLYSDSITELLQNEQVIKPLKVSTKGISFLLQSGVVPPTYTAYENIFIVGIGDTAKVFTKDAKIEIEFSHEFPFMNENRLKKEQMTPDTDHILKLIADATVERIDPSKESFLFHSAGKDSNTIALALAEAGYQDKVTLITHKSKGDKDESEISKSIADKLGFKHKILYEVDELQDEHKKAINEYFVNAPFPCTDNVSLAYPLYAHQMPELRGANILDGGGNDVYMMTPPSSRDMKILPFSKITQNLGFLRNFTNFESKLTPLLRTPAEWFGMSGLSFADTEMILPNADNVYSYWKNESDKRKDWDIYDFKTDILTTVIASELHIRKARNFADSIGSNMILPFANEKVASYFATMPEEYLFDRKLLKNKLILRKLLKKEIELDSDKIGKMGWVYDKNGVVLNNLELIKKEILSCDYWNQDGVEKLILRFEKHFDKSNRVSEISKSLIYRLYLLSAWLNKNRYIK